jgi:acylphosphatase
VKRFDLLEANPRTARREPASYNSPFPMIVAKRFFVSGRVQGVGFRYFVQDHAAVEGVHGYVRNLPDGRVEVLVEGDEESVLRVERALRRGPMLTTWSSRRQFHPAGRRAFRSSERAG